MKHILAAVQSRIQAGYEDAIRRFFRQNPNPTDPMVHKFAVSLGLTPEALEAEIYRLFTECNDEAMGSWCQARGCMQKSDTTMVPQRQTPLSGALSRMRRN